MDGPQSPRRSQHGGSAAAHHFEGVVKVGNGLFGSYMKRPIVVGVVGCGYWGPNLVRNFKGLPNCNLKAMCDVSEARLKHLRSLYSGVEGLTDFEHMLNGMGLDAVVIATPVTHHYAQAKASLLAGK